MLERILKVISAISLMPHVTINEKEQRNLDPDIFLPQTIIDIIGSASFWSEIKTI